MAARHVLAIDQGTTSTRAIVFDARAAGASAQKELPQIFPKPGWVEHDPEQIWSATVEVCREALARAKLDAQRWPASASPTSARPRSCGTAAPASRSTTPSSGRTAAPPNVAMNCGAAGTKRRSRPRPA
jgi:Glycerol kinase